MATGIEFDIIVTREGIDYARQLQGGQSTGWHLTPKRYEISSESGTFNDQRTMETRKTASIWVQNPFSGIYPSGTNKIVNNIVIPANANNGTASIKEIYFIYQNNINGNNEEFLFAIAKPREDLDFNYGVTLSFKFVFTLTNITDIESIIDVIYSNPQDIIDHNNDPNAHAGILNQNALLKDGSVNATGVLSYATAMTFSGNNNLITKGYVTDQVNTLNNTINTLSNRVNTLSNELNNKANTSLSNINDAAKSSIKSFNAPKWSGKITITSGEFSTGTYTCPDNGYIIYVALVGETTSYHSKISVNNILLVDITGAFETYGNGVIPVNKNDVVSYELTSFATGGYDPERTIYFVPFNN